MNDTLKPAESREGQKVEKGRGQTQVQGRERQEGTEGQTGGCNASLLQDGSADTST